MVKFIPLEEQKMIQMRSFQIPEAEPTSIFSITNVSASIEQEINVHTGKYITYIYTGGVFPTFLQLCTVCQIRLIAI